MATITARAAEGRIDGSFRDPSGYVFRRDGRIYRAIDGGCRRTLQSLHEGGLLPELMREKLLVQTRFVEDPEERLALAHGHGPYEHFLEHEVLAPITYPVRDALPVLLLVFLPAALLAVYWRAWLGWPGVSGERSGVALAPADVSERAGAV